jgi:hypothetical protein
MSSVRDAMPMVPATQQIAATDSATLHVGYPEFANRTIIPEIL